MNIYSFATPKKRNVGYGFRSSYDQPGAEFHQVRLVNDSN